MSVETWPQGQESNRSRTIIATAAANSDVPTGYFTEPAGPGTPAKAMIGPPPDQGKPKGKPAGTKPSEQTTPRSKPAKGE